MLKRLDDILSAIEVALIVSLTLAGLAMAFVQVVLRYVFNTGVHWLEAGLVTALIWAMLIGAVRAVRQGLHPRVDLVVDMVSPRGRAVLNFLALLATLALIGLFLWDAIFYGSFINMINVLHPELGIKLIYPFLIIPISMGLMAVRYALLAVAFWRQPDSHSLDGAFREILLKNPTREATE